MNFSSDNVAGAHEAVLRAVVEASANAVPAYGDDALSAEAETALQNLFETECAVFFVTTGTAANALVLSAICPPWGAVYCHVDAHILNDENTAVELFSGGARLVGIAGHAGKPDPVSLQEAIESAISHGCSQRATRGDQSVQCHGGGHRLHPRGAAGLPPHCGSL
jgi:threonine aldolase